MSKNFTSGAYPCLGLRYPGRCLILRLTSSSGGVYKFSFESKITGSIIALNWLIIFPVNDFLVLEKITQRIGRRRRKKSISGQKHFSATVCEVLWQKDYFSQLFICRTGATMTMFLFTTNIQTVDNLGGEGV